ncbi:MAG: signal peptidase I [Anaerovoracaceae bacterium]
MLKKILVKAVSVISIVLIVISLIVLFTVVTTKSGEPPRILGYSVLRVMTGSMEPAIPVDALIVVKQTDADTLSEGDVISFYSRDPALAGAVNTHRIIGISETDGEKIFETQGDANNVADRYVTHEKDIVGKVIYSSRVLGKLLRLISNPLVFFPFVICPLFIMICVNLYRSVRTTKKLVREEEEAAVREAIREIRERNRKQNAEQKPDTFPEEKLQDKTNDE